MLEFIALTVVIVATIYVFIKVKNSLQNKGNSKLISIFLSLSMTFLTFVILIVIVSTSFEDKTKQQARVIEKYNQDIIQEPKKDTETSQKVEEKKEVIWTNLFFWIFIILVVIIIVSKKKKLKKESKDIIIIEDVSVEVVDEKKIHYNELSQVEIIDEDEETEETYPNGTPIELIEAYERAEYDAVRVLLQKIAYGMVDKSVSQKDKDDFKKVMTYFANHDPLYKEIIVKLIPIIAKDEGILQSKIYPYLPDYDIETLKYVLYFAHELGDLRREKKGRSYQLFTSTYSSIELLEE